MFTIKHIQGGAETLYQAVGVKRHHSKLELNHPDGKFTNIAGRERPDGSGGIGDATIYVMNDAGKTVATYHLSPPLPEPAMTQRDYA